MKIFRNSLWAFLGLNYIVYLWEILIDILYKIDINFDPKLHEITVNVNTYVVFVSIGVGIMGIGLTAIMAIKQFREQHRIEKNVIILLILYILCLSLGCYLLYGITTG